MEDKDNIRVDLLKLRRKAYLEYPEGSKERKMFLKTILENELKLTEMEMPKEILNLVMEGDKMVFWDSLRKSIAWFGLGVLSYFAAFSLRHSALAIPFYICGPFFLGMGGQYLYEYWLYRESVKSVKKYSQDMNQHINKISNDIKRLEGPK
jgi:hypothetical protein